MARRPPSTSNPGRRGTKSKPVKPKPKKGKK